MTWSTWSNVLRFLADKAGRFTVEANAKGLFLELPSGLDRYVEAHLPKALPELRLSREDNGRQPSGRSFFLCVGPLSSDLLRWATEGSWAGRCACTSTRDHMPPAPHRPMATCPPGRWLRLPASLRRLWHRLPVWDELSAGVRLSSLFPPTGDGAVYSSRSRLLQLVPPDDYHPDEGGRDLGQTADGRPLTLSRNVPLFTVGAPFSFLVRQALNDLELWADCGRRLTPPPRPGADRAPGRRIPNLLARSTEQPPLGPPAHRQRRGMGRE